MRLFVDCDDTLILYSQTGINPYGVHYGTPYIVNEGLAEFIRQYAAAMPDALIVIWSGGGKEYARECAKLAGVDDIGAAYLIKDRSTFDLVDKDSIVFDDQFISVGATVRGPHEVDL